MKIVKTDNQAEANMKKASFLSSLVDEKTEEEIRIEMLIREKYSISQELCLHREKLMRKVDSDEWNEYTAYVEECIEKVRSEEN